MYINVGEDTVVSFGIVLLLKLTLKSTEIEAEAIEPAKFVVRMLVVCENPIGQTCCLFVRLYA